MTTKTKAATAADKIVVLRKYRCPNASGRAELEYAIGQDNSKAFYISITSSSGGGFFSNEWVAWNDIKATLEKFESFTSTQLQGLFKGKSVNTPAFLVAAITDAGLASRLPNKQRQYRLTGKNPTAKKAPVNKPSAKKKARSRTK